MGGEKLDCFDSTRLAGAVSHDHEKLIDESTLGSVRRDANKFFTKNSIPITISTRDGFCSMAPR